MTQADKTPAPDETMIRIGKGMQLSQQGQTDQARDLFTQLWEAIGPDGDPFHQLAVAHWMADVQDDPHQELIWDLRALQAADLVTDERASQGGVTSSVQGFYPSLHLNLGEAYRKLGDLPAARHHLELGRAATPALNNDGYGTMITNGLESLASRLNSE
jgi:tetratricopeptide (TPR) repeat protein